MTFLCFSELDSTNEEAKRIARNPVQELEWPIVITADRQTRGRGTHGRVWESDSEGGLYYTLLTHPKAFDFHRIPDYHVQVATCVVKTILELTSIQTEVKWPNDIILDGKKMGGILIEAASVANSTQPRYVIIGIGLNVNQISFSPEIQNVAISLKQITGQTYNKTLFRTALTAQLGLLMI